MRKHRILSLITSCALAISFSSSPVNTLASEPTQDTTKAQAENKIQDTSSTQTGTASGGDYLSRTLISENNGLRHYAYTDENGETVTLKGGTKTASKKKKATNLPSSYSSVPAGKVTSIKDQGETGACWAFGALKALEASSISTLNATAETVDFSENHLAWYAYNPETNPESSLYGDQNIATDSTTNIYGQGGDALMAIATLANWWGAADESAAPFEDGTGGSTKMENLMKKAPDDLRYQAKVHLKDASCYDNTDISIIKQAVIDYGVINVSHFFPENRHDAKGMVYQNGNDYSMYQTRRSAEDANHSVSIVGWDDNYSAFLNTPPEPGAWLIANSWGEDSTYSNNGYYWVSYYDASLGDFYSYEPDSANKYDTNYGYDGAGYCGAMRYNCDAAAANIFTNTSGVPQEINAVSFYTLAHNQGYNIHIYRNVTGNTPDSGEYMTNVNMHGIMAFSGFHTVMLNNSVPIAPNERFAIVITYKYDGQKIGIPLEGDKSSTTIALNRFHQVEYKKYSSSPNQSFLYDAQTGWADSTRYPGNSGSSFFSSDSTTNYNNVCVRAYANNITKEQYNQSQSSYKAVSKSMEEIFTGKKPAASTSPAASDAPVVTAEPAVTAAPTVDTTPVESSAPVVTSTPAANNTPAESSAPATTTPTASTSPAANITPAESSAPVATSTPSAEPSADTSPGTILQEDIVEVAPLIKSMTIGKGERVSLSYSLSDDDDVSFISKNTGIAKVNNAGVVTGTGTGKTKITLKTSTGGSCSVTINVKNAPKKVTVSATKKKIKKGKKLKLQVKLPAGSASYQLTYQSSNKKIAAVSKKGVVTAKKKGTVKITVTTFNGKRAVIKLKVMS